MNEQIIDIQEVRDSMNKRIPLGRPARPRDVAFAVAFLSISAADYITGETLVVDGGLIGYHPDSILSLLGKL